VTASAALLLTLTAGNTFFQDSWAFFFEREGNSPGDFLRPHNEHISCWRCSGSARSFPSNWS
jgi:hypothetical protein